MNDDIKTATPADSFDLEKAKVAISGLLKAETNEEKNALLQSIDSLMASAFPKNPDEAMGILMMAQTLAFRRLLAHHGLTNRGHVHRVIRKATEEFEKRLRAYS